MVFLRVATESLTTRAGDPQSVLPADRREASIQTPEEFFGFPLGSRHLRHDQVVAYLRYLAQVSDRLEIIPYGETHGKRPLMVALITSPSNREQLEDIKRHHARLSSGRDGLDLDEDDKLIMWLGYSIHGDEASAVNAAPLVAYHLVSSRSEEVVRGLESSLYLLDPALNPDGVDRFANWANENRGKYPSSLAAAREHDQPWPGGRTNYYYFDLNRDWLPVAHPESQGRLRLYHQWKPNVVLDFHEMSSDSSYFFQPGMPARNNPLSPLRNLDLTRLFAQEHARQMNSAAELFFTEERFDDFYVGKGSTYPDLHGSVGILFEQGSTRGLVAKSDRYQRHFRDTVANQVRMSLSSLHVAAQEREALLELQLSFYQNALKSGKSDTTRAYLLSGTPSRIRAAAGLLRQHNVRMHQPSEGSIVFQGATLPATNVLIIPMAQPEVTFARSLMEPLQNFAENIFYDVSAWHLPSAFDLEYHLVDSDLPPSWLGPVVSLSQSNSSAKVSSQGEADTSKESEPPIGYAFSPVELESASLVAVLHSIEAHVRVTTEPLESEQRSWPMGTYLVLKQPNLQHWTRTARVLQSAGERFGIDVVPLASSMTRVGPDLGSDSLMEIPVCKPLLVVGEGTDTASAGSIWHFLDHRMHQAATLVDTSQLSSVDLRDFTCVILPAGSYGGVSESVSTRLGRYTDGGGTVIAVGSAIRWLERHKLISLHDDGLAKAVEDEASLLQTPQHKPRYGDAADWRALETIAGAFFQTVIDSSHPLAYGFPDSIVPIFREHEMRFPVPRNPYQTAAVMGDVIAGYVSDRNRGRLDESAAVWIEAAGQGNYIMLADNPVFRGYVRSSERFLTNAMLLGPSIRVPSSTFSSSAAEADEHH
jgi:hypothetical protein